METSTINIIVSSAGSVIVGVSGMWITASQLGKRVDRVETDIGELRTELRNEIRDFRTEIRDFRTEFNTFKDLVNGKFAALDLEIAKLMDRGK